MKIYTRTGDDGTTGLFGGPRVPKDNLRLDAYGTLDEANAALGLAAAGLPPDSIFPHLLTAIQNELFALGAHLATPADNSHRDKLPPLSATWITRLESQIDSADAQLAPLANFI